MQWGIILVKTNCFPTSFLVVAVLKGYVEFISYFVYIFVYNYKVVIFIHSFI